MPIHRTFEVTMTEWERYPLIVYYLLLVFIGLIGNSLILVFFTTSPKYRDSTYRIFILELAFADFVCCGLIPLTKIPMIFTGGIWVMGDFSCRILWPVTWMTVSVSSWIICGLCYDRYMAISHPFGDRLSKKKIVVFCALSWLLSLAFCLPLFYFTEIESGQCSRMYPEDIRYFMRYFDFAKDVVKGYIPTLTSLILLYKMNKTLKEHKRQVLNMHTKTNNIHRKLRKTYKFVFKTSLAFVVCILPATISNGLKNLAHNKPTVIPMTISELEILDKVLGWTWGLSYMNCSINCFIYAGRFPEFRRFIKSCFRQIFCLRKNKLLLNNFELGAAITSNQQPKKEKGLPGLRSVSLDS